MGGYGPLRAHPFFESITWENLQHQTPPKLTAYLPAMSEDDEDCYGNVSPLAYARTHPSVAVCVCECVVCVCECAHSMCVLGWVYAWVCLGVRVCVHVCVPRCRVPSFLGAQWVCAGALGAQPVGRMAGGAGTDLLVAEHCAPPAMSPQ